MKAKQLPDNYNPLNNYSVDEAAALLPQLSTSKFVGSVDIDVVLAISEKQKKEAVKGSVVFTNTLGGEKKVIVFGDEKEAKAALACHPCRWFNARHRTMTVRDRATSPG